MDVYVLSRLRAGHKAGGNGEEERPSRTYRAGRDGRRPDARSVSAPK